MTPFEFHRPETIDHALAQAQVPRSYFIGGGTNLLDLMKGGVEQPARLVDINGLKLDAVVEQPDGGLRIGAGARNSDVANHALVRQRYPLLSQALLAGASPQLRNMATVGGNLMQRTRCGYFVDTAFVHCNKRNPGSGCAARHGDNSLHAILGASEHCVAVNPSDMSVALLALDAHVVVREGAGERRIRMADFHRLPGDRPQQDSNLKPGALIVAVELGASPYAAASHYLKVRERASYAFALVAVAVGLQIDAGVVRSARIALGGVAHRPWLAQEAADRLVGQAIDSMDLTAVAELATKDAQPLTENAYKIPLLKNALMRATRTAAGLA